MNELDKLTWRELYDRYKKYSDRLAQIEKYLKILPDKKAMTPAPRDVRDAAIRTRASTYKERLWSDIININQKIMALDAEIERRKSLIGATA